MDQSWNSCPLNGGPLLHLWRSGLPKFLYISPNARKTYWAPVERTIFASGNRLRLQRTTSMCLWSGRGPNKSIDMFCQGFSGIGVNVRDVFIGVADVIWHSWQFSSWSFMALSIPGKQKSTLRRRLMASCPRCDPSWAREMASCCRLFGRCIWSPLCMSSFSIDSSLKSLYYPRRVGSLCGGWLIPMKWHSRVRSVSLSCASCKRSLVITVEKRGVLCNRNSSLVFLCFFGNTLR